MKPIRSLLLAGTVISGTAIFLDPAAGFAANGNALLIAQAEQAPPPAELSPEELKELEQKKQEQKQQEQKQQEQKQEAPPPAEAPPPKEAPPPADAPPPPAEKQAPPPADAPPPPAEKQAPPPADTPPPPPPPPADTPAPAQDQQRTDTPQPPVPPVPPLQPKSDAPPSPVPPQPQQPADTPPPADPGAAAPAPAPEAPSVAPAPTPKGEQPAIPPEELKGGAMTPEQKQRREERVEREFKNRDKKLDQRFNRRVEERGDRTIIREGDNRIIVRDGGRTIIRSDETERFRRNASDVRQERGRNDEMTTIVIGPGGIEIVTVKDRDGNLIRRSRREGGRETVLIDNRGAWERGGHWDRNRGWRDHGRDGLHISFYLDLPPVRVTIPREEYIIDADRGSYDDFEEAFGAPPLVATERPYSLQEVTQNVRLRERVRSVDLNTITFATAEWQVRDDQVPMLEDIARAMKAVIDRDPTQVYLVEGHTDAVGSALDNLSLSDRRAEEVAAILTEYYQIPAENLVTQGYGEDYLKVNTLAANEENRRVTIRNITGLLQVQQAQNAPR